MGRSNILAYYSSGDAIEGAEKRLSALKTQLSGLTSPSLSHSSTIVDAVAAANDVEPKSEYMILAESIQREEQALSELRSVNFKGSFHIIPGRTILKIPSSASVINKPSSSIGDVLSSITSGRVMSGGTSNGSNISGFPTRFVFQIINPARSFHSSISEISGGVGADNDTQVDFAGNTFDFLTLCADSAQRRREWLLRLRANSQVPISQLGKGKVGGGEGGTDNIAKPRAGSDVTPNTSQVDNSLQIIYLGTLPLQKQDIDSVVVSTQGKNESSSPLSTTEVEQGESIVSYDIATNAVPPLDLASSHRAAITKALRQRLETWDEKANRQE
jgi:hypothetical protein